MARRRQEMIACEDQAVEEWLAKGPLLEASGEINFQFGCLLRKYALEHRDTVYRSLGVGQDSFFYPLSTTDSSVYFGDGGLALMNYHLFKTLGRGSDRDFLDAAINLIERPLRQVKLDRVTFLTGDAGLLALGAVLFHLVGRHLDSRECIRRLCSMSVEVLMDPQMQNDLTFGRAGYLYALLFVRREMGYHHRAVDEDLIKQVFQKVVEDGRQLAEQEERGQVLMFRRHGRSLLGAKHGMAGIFHTLLQTDVVGANDLLWEWMPACLDYMMPMKMESNNRPSEETMDRDVLVAWCHGAAGWVHMFAKAYEMFKEERYLEAAKEAEEVTWQRGFKGLLRDRHGLCHGMAGNGYSILALYRITGDSKYLQRACKIAHKCFRFSQNFVYQIPKHPFSLYEGLAGTVCFLADMLDPKRARFPGYEL